MKREALLTALAALSITAALPAAAQSPWDYQRDAVRFHGGVGGDYNTVLNNMRSGMSNISGQINSQVAAGQMSGAQASMLMSQLRNLENMVMSMGSDRVFSTGEVQQMLANFNALSAQVSNTNSIAIPPLNGAYGYNNYGYPAVSFRDYNSVDLYRQQLLNQINAARISDALRRTFRNEYNSIAPYLNRRYVSGNYNNNQYVRKMIRLNERLRDNMRVADRHRKWY
ncbi:MAG: hypothetical protein K2X93_22340 [Candidatus Obscuribacterales bacterium]|nr:hypothetical protein [Candidatus Obscuribacterales bacterium]